MFAVPVGTTLSEIQEKLLDAKFKEFRWLHDELLLWEEAHQHIELEDLDVFEDDTTLCLKLINKHYFRGESKLE